MIIDMEFVCIMIVLIPVVAVVDYFAFRDALEKELGEPPRWYRFVIPSALEILCFVAGYWIGKVGFFP